MTRQTLFSIFLVIFLHTPNPGSIKTLTAVQKIGYTTTTAKASMTNTREQTGHALPASQLPGHDVGLKPIAHKIHLMKFDELAHIHRFHKERVKKIRRHHNKYWMLAKTLIIVCHIVLLVSAFLHLTH